MEYLEGYKGVSALPKAKSEQTLYRAVDVESAIAASLESDLIKIMSRAAKKLKVTVNTLFQHAWGKVLAKELSEHDVSFGLVSSGRGSLKTPNHHVGMYMNVVPVRIQCDVGNYTDQIKALHEDIQSIIVHDSVSIAELETQKALENYRELINTLYTFESTSMQVDNEDSIQFNTITNSPLTLIVKWGTSPQLVFSYNPDVFDEEYVNSLARQLVSQIGEESQKIITESDSENSTPQVTKNPTLKVFGALETSQDAIVLIHGGMSGYEIFNKLIPCLQKPVIAIESFNLRCAIDRNEHFIDDFNEMGRLYLQQVKAVAPGKHLTIVAFSQGGLIASAMLKESKKHDIDIKETFLLDAFLLSAREKIIRHQLQLDYVNQICSNQNILEFYGVTTEQMKGLADVELDALMKFELDDMLNSKITLIKAQNIYKVKDNDYHIFLSGLVQKSSNGWENVTRNLTKIMLPTDHFGLLDEQAEHVALIINNKLKQRTVA